MNYLVSGSTGFIGSRLCPNLERHGHSVIRVGRKTYPCDIPDNIDYFIHLAGLTIRKCDVGDSSAFLESNVLFTHEVLELARGIDGLKKFIHVSTGEVYGPVLDGELHTEEKKLSPVNSYTESKACSDQLVMGRSRQFGIPSVILRPCDVYGKGMAPKSFIPVVVNAILNGDFVRIYGDGKQKHQWLHVDDLVEAILFSCIEAPAGEVYNVPGSERCSNLELIYMIEDALGKKGVHQYFDPPAERGPEHLWGISGRKIEKLGWRPLVSLREGLTDFCPRHALPLV